MSSVVDIVVKAQDLASKVFESVDSASEKATNSIAENWTKVTAAGAVAGAAMEGFARTQADTNAIIARMSIITGESEESIRASIASMNTWNFSAESAAAGMDLLARRGITTKEGFETILPVIDNFSDATGREMTDAITVIDSAMRALGIPLTEVSEYIDTFTYLSERSTVPLEMIERQLGKVGPELQAMGLDLNDTAAYLIALEGKGYSGRESLRLFAMAAEKSQGDLEAMKIELGLTDSEIEDYTSRLEDAGGMTDQFAAVNNDTMTIMQRMQASLSNLGARFGGLASAASMAAPIIIAIGPASKGASLAMGWLTGSTGALSGAMSFLAANPIVLVIAAITAAVAAIVLLYQKNETFREFVLAVWEKIQTAISGAWDNVISPIWEAMKVGFGCLADAAKVFCDAWKAVFEAAAEVLGWIWSNVIKPIWEGIKLYWQAVGAVIGAVWDSAIKPVWDLIQTGIERLKESFGKFRDAWSSGWHTIKEIAKGVIHPIIGMFNAIIGGFESVINGIAKAINAIPAIGIPTWVPGPLGGKHFGIPEIGPVTLPRIPSLASGGIARATPGGLLALIAEGGRSERISPIGGPDDPMMKILDKLVELIRVTKEARTMSVDGRELATAIGLPLVQEIRHRTGL